MRPFASVSDICSLRCPSLFCANFECLHWKRKGKSIQTIPHSCIFREFSVIISAGKRLERGVVWLGISNWRYFDAYRRLPGAIAPPYTEGGWLHDAEIPCAHQSGQPRRLYDRGYVREYGCGRRPLRADFGRGSGVGTGYVLTAVAAEGGTPSAVMPWASSLW